MRAVLWTDWCSTHSQFDLTFLSITKRVLGVLTCMYGSAVCLPGAKLVKVGEKI